MAIIFTPEFFKEQFRNGKTIRQISTENYVSPSYVSHIVNGFATVPRVTRRRSVPPNAAMSVGTRVSNIAAINMKMNIFDLNNFILLSSPKIVFAESIWELSSSVLEQISHLSFALNYS